MLGSIKRDPAGIVLQRVSGLGRLGVHNASGTSRITELYQDGACRLRLPRVATGMPPEIITINTAGGLTGGDHLELTVAVGRDAETIVSSQACEKIYRAADGEVRIATSISLEAASRIAWLAQPMIVFDHARVRRTLAVDMADDASFLAVDGMILGRTAMGEEVTTGHVHDGWRIRRGGKLVVADAFRVGPDIASACAHPATFRARRALATIIYCAPDAETRLAQARTINSSLAAEAVASAWNGVLLNRFLSQDGHRLIADLIQFLTEFRGRPMPRTWAC